MNYMSLSVLGIERSVFGFWHGVMRANLEAEKDTFQLAFPPPDENDVEN